MAEKSVVEIIRHANNGPSGGGSYDASAGPRLIVFVKD